MEGLALVMTDPGFESDNVGLLQWGPLAELSQPFQNSGKCLHTILLPGLLYLLSGLVTDQETNFY